MNDRVEVCKYEYGRWQRRETNITCDIIAKSGKAELSNDHYGLAEYRDTRVIEL